MGSKDKNRGLLRCCWATPRRVGCRHNCMVTVLLACAPAHVRKSFFVDYKTPTDCAHIGGRHSGRTACPAASGGSPARSRIPPCPRPTPPHTCIARCPPAPAPTAGAAAAPPCGPPPLGTAAAAGRGPGNTGKHCSETSRAPEAAAGPLRGAPAPGGACCGSAVHAACSESGTERRQGRAAGGRSIRDLTIGPA